MHTNTTDNIETNTIRNMNTNTIMNKNTNTITNVDTNMNVKWGWLCYVHKSPLLKHWSTRPTVLANFFQICNLFHLITQYKYGTYMPT